MGISITDLRMRAEHSRLDVDRWGKYHAAVDRWEQIIDRRATSPLVEGATPGSQVLSPVFVEWMMGYPQGWVTDILGRTASLKALGNAVVPQQARLAWHLLQGMT